VPASPGHLPPDSAPRLPLPGRQALPVPASPVSFSTDSRLSQLRSLLAPVGWTLVGSESLLYRDFPLQSLPFTIGLAVLDVVATELLNL